VSQPASLTWLASHELRLGWRDWTSLMTAGGRTRARTAAIALTAFAGFMHVLAYWTVASFANANLASDTATLVGITGSLVLSWSLLLSQGMESVTRAFYSRSDLDLVLTSPASARKVFAVRTGRIAAASVAIAVLLAAPFINVLAVLGGSRWLSAYGVVAAMGAVATAAALSLTVALFRIIGAKRTRLIAQIVAAVIVRRSLSFCRLRPFFPPAACLASPHCSRSGCCHTRPTRAAPSGGPHARCLEITRRWPASWPSALLRSV
jgi:ABC-2 type transport system permease protein